MREIKQFVIKKIKVKYAELHFRVLRNVYTANKGLHTFLRRCSSGIPETIPISPGLTSTKASEEKHLDGENGIAERRQRRDNLKPRCREFAIFTELEFPHS